MTLKALILKTLEEQPNFRLRRRKDIGLVTLLKGIYPELESVPHETLVAVVQDFNSLDRLWRQALQENAHLRGSDYNDRVVLAQKKALELGYQPRFHQNVKTLSNL